MEDKLSKLNDSKEQLPSEKAEVVLPDECGDTLWDQVLQQRNKCIYPTGTCERDGVLSNIIVAQGDQEADKTPVPDRYVSK
ncbi:MAG: hypothetical protein ABIQ31_14515 [Ferruginibacter sp.]